MNEVRNIIVGFDFGEKVSQICYYDRTEGEPVSLSVTAGQSQYTFPTILSKKPGEDVYHYGTEAEYFGIHKDEILIDNLYELCLIEKGASIDNEEIRPAYLLKVFIGNVLKMLGVADPIKSISAIMITTPRLTRGLVENIRQAYALLGFDRARCFLQGYEESFYYHTMSQKPELRSRKTALFCFDKDDVEYKELAVDKQTKPALVTVQRGPRAVLSQDPKDRDQEFYDLIRESFGNEVYSSVFLVGEGFDKSWAVKSIPLLCRNHRHVFYGNNLFCKGACYAAKEKAEDKALKEYLYAGEDLVKSNIGMEMTISGIPAYYSMIEAGVNWYEALHECEIMLNDTQELVFIITGMDPGVKNKCSMPLPGLPKRPVKATRLKIRIEYESAHCCNIEVEDLGLGELYSASGLTWKETMRC